MPTGFRANANVNYWLLKSDPETYSFADLQRDGRTTWDGVRNAQALVYLRQMKKGDLALVYHSGTDKHIAGLAEIVRGPYADPKVNDEKLVVVDIGAKSRAAKPVTLAQIKADAAFAEFLLVRNSRLSVMPVPAAMWKKLVGMAELRV